MSFSQEEMMTFRPSNDRGFNEVDTRPNMEVDRAACTSLIGNFVNLRRQIQKTAARLDRASLLPG